jgi:hypothetical protein
MGKGNVQNTSEFYKFLGLYSVGSKTETAIKELLTPSKNKSKNSIEHNSLKEKAILIDSNIKYSDLKKENVYIKLIK